MSTCQTHDASTWRQVTHDKPCPICRETRRCGVTTDGRIAKCCHVENGSFKTDSDDVGDAYYHQLIDDSPVVTATEPGTVHSVYDAMLTTSPYVSAEHTADLKRRGLDDQTILNHGYRSLDRGAANHLARELHLRFGDYVFKVPGFSKWNDGKPRLFYPHHKHGDGGKSTPVSGVLLVPVRNVNGKIVGVKVRIYDPDWDGAKYVWLSSKSSGGIGATNAVHVPLGTPSKSPTVRITEGELKADIAFHLDGITTISIPGVSSWRKALEVLVELGAEIVQLAFDADCWTNPDVAKALRNLFNALVKANYKVEIVHWDITIGKGIDDLLLAGGTPQIATGDDARKLADQIVAAATNQPENTEDESPDDDPERNSGRPVIFCSLNELEVNNKVEAHLAGVDGIYQRGGMLVRSCRDAPPCPGVVRPPQSPTIRELPESGLREILSSILGFEDIVKDRRKAVRVPCHITKALHQRGEWSGIAKLEAICTFPVVRSDGSIISANGYDPQTGLFIHFPDQRVSVPVSPTADDARAAVAVLADVVFDFPFQSMVHLSCWLSMLLTPLARFAFSGPTPLFCLDANVRGAGKTLLAELMAQIVTGSDFARMSPCRDDDEMRKRITSIALRGDPLILLDNVAGELGGPSLDAALTSTSWSDRVLGASRQVTLPLNSVWVATGNNIQLLADTTRRVCHIRLISPEERPEERTGFKYPDILNHVRANRSELLSAALTILAAYFHAGRPKLPMKPWGSYEGWSSVVRQSLLFAGQPDPAESREELIATSDSGANLLHDLLCGWESADTNNRGLTCAEVIEKLSDQYCPTSLKNSVLELCNASPGKLPSSVSLGKHLRRFRLRVSGGRCFDFRENTDKVKVWKIISATKAGDTGDTGDI